MDDVAAFREACQRGNGGGLKLLDCPLPLLGRQVVEQVDRGIQIQRNENARVLDPFLEGYSLGVNIPKAGTGEQCRECVDIAQ